MSSLAAAMKTLYESIKAKSIAQITIHDLPLELQLPPYLDSMLHAQDEPELDAINPHSEDGQPNPWGSMSVGWRLPALKPWKSLLRLDDEDERGKNELIDLVRGWRGSWLFRLWWLLSGMLVMCILEGFVCQ